MDMIVDNEEWRVVESWPYEVSSLGRVRRTGGRRIAIRSARRGYQAVWLSAIPRQRQVSVHALVSHAFLGPRPEGMEVNHRDGDKRNNRLSNLEYVTPAENRDHARALHLYPRGERNAFARLTETLVREIRRRVAAGTSRREVARDLGFSRSAIDRAASGETWGHVA